MPKEKTYSETQVKLSLVELLKEMGFLTNKQETSMQHRKWSPPELRKIIVGCFTALKRENEQLKLRLLELEGISKDAERPEFPGFSNRTMKAPPDYRQEYLAKIRKGKGVSELSWSR